MKKTFNINIVGYPFTIDEDAYALLNDYLKTIEHAFRKVDGSAELINDIESRIAELLLQSSEDGSAIITLADVEQVIARVGKPEEFVDDETITIQNENGDTETINVDTENETPPPYIPNPPYTVKRLYRDPQNAMLGGVCSGIAWYLGWDVTWVRLLLVALTIVSYATMAVVYLVLWIVVPEARTPLQRMQMMGEQPTMENIGKTVTDSFKEDQGSPANQQISSAPDIAKVMTTGVGWLGKAFIIIGLIIGIPILFGLGLGLIGAVVFLIAWGSALLFGTGMPFDNPEMNDPFVSKLVFWGVLCGIGWILTIGIPLLALIRKGLNSDNLSRQTSLLVKIIWCVGFLLAGVATGMVVSTVGSQELYRNQQWEERRRNGDFDVVDENEAFKIQISNLSAEMIQTKIESINSQAEDLQKQAESFQEQADQWLQQAEEMSQKIEQASSEKQASKYRKMAEKYNRHAEKAQHKAEKAQNNAQKLLDKSEILTDKLMELSTDAALSIPAASDSVPTNDSIKQ